MIYLFKLLNEWKQVFKEKFKLHKNKISSDKSDLLKISFLTSFIFMLANIIVVLFRLYPTRTRKVIYWSKTFRYEGNVKALYLEWTKQKGYKHIWLVKNQDQMQIINNLNLSNTTACNVHNIQTFYHLSTAKYWIKETDLNSPGIRPRKETFVVQLWHAAGAFKKFGANLKRNGRLQKIRKKDSSRWDLLLCSSEEIIDIYSQAFFQFPKNKIITSGLPRNDLLFQYLPHKTQIRQELGFKQNKVFILYAPTFRDTNSDSCLFNHAVNYLVHNLPDNFLLGVRLHPSLLDKISIDSDILNLSYEADVEKVLSVTDILITDYSSIIFDFALLKKPIIFYMPDIDNYIDSRGFYYNLQLFIPGPICTTLDALQYQITHYDSDLWGKKIKSFRDKFQPDFDGMNSIRVLNKILELSK